MYVVDTNSWSVLRNFYPKAFKTFWQQLDALVAGGEVVSVREVQNELKRVSHSEHLDEWLDANKGLFSGPTEDELEFVAEIFKIDHFRQLVGRHQVLVGNPAADPFVIARAKILGGCVVTEEKLKPNAAQIPNVCDHFDIECVNLEGLIEAEGWEF